MRLAILVAVVALSVVACGGKDTPTAPAIQAANITTSGSGAWVTCIGGSCNFQGDARNVGAGCASTVRGVTRFYDAAGTQLISSSWGLGTRIIRSGEAFTYKTVDFITPAQQAAAVKYLTEPAWTDVGC